MSDMYMDVDVALAEVPVNVMPLIDDTDFKTREVAVAYNAAGMDLVWNFVTTLGAFTQTAVVPTTAGVHDWTHQGDGMYTLEIPASAGTINNNLEGHGWFSGVATGVLPWRGPILVFRAAGLNNALIDGAYSATRGLAGTALPDAAADAAGGLPISDVGGLDLDNEANSAFFTSSAQLVDDIFDEVLTGATHDVADSLGRRIRNLQENGWYEGGEVFVDTIDGTAGTTLYENGTSLNAVLTLADAIAIAGHVDLNIHRFRMTPDSTILFAEAHVSEVWSGDGWTLQLGGRDISETHINHCEDVSGVSTSPTGECHFFDSHIGNVTVGKSHFTQCTLMATVTLGAASIYVFDDCSAEIGIPVIDMGAAIGASTVYISKWSGNLTINNLAVGDVVIMDGVFGDVILNGADATVKLQGVAASVTSNLTGSPAVSDKTVKSDDIAAIMAIVDDLNLGIIYGTAQVGTLSVNAMTTDLTGYGDNELDGRVVVFTGGTADGQAAVIDTYAAASGLITFQTPLTTAPVNLDPFKLV